MKRLLYILSVVFAIQGCNDNELVYDDPLCGGPCCYDTIPGTAEITLIVPDTLINRICNNAVFVYFDFSPNDSSAQNDYKHPNWPDTDRRIHVADGKNPPSSWVDALGLTEGTKHSCVRLEEIRGTCTPVLFRFSGIDYSSWMDYCEPMN